MAPTPNPGLTWILASFLILQMADWFDTLGDVIYHIAHLFMDSSRPRRSVGIAFAAITSFAVIGTLIAVSLGTNLDPAGYFVLIALLLTTSSIACYCFFTNRIQYGFRNWHPYRCKLQVANCIDQLNDRPYNLTNDDMHTKHSIGGLRFVNCSCIGDAGGSSFPKDCDQGILNG